MQDVVNVYNLRCPIDGVEDAPVSYRVLTQIGKVLCNRLMAMIVNIGGDPLCLIELPLGHGLTGL